MIRLTEQDGGEGRYGEICGRISSVERQSNDQGREIGELKTCSKEMGGRVDDVEDRLNKKDGWSAGWRVAMTVIWGLILILWGFVMFRLTQIESKVEKLADIMMHKEMQSINSKVITSSTMSTVARMYHPLIERRE